MLAHAPRILRMDIYKPISILIVCLILSDFVYVSQFQIRVPCPPFYNEFVYRVRFSSSTKGKNYFVCGPTAQRTQDKNKLWAIIKNDNEVYAHLISDTGLVQDL